MDDLRRRKPGWGIDSPGVAVSLSTQRSLSLSLVLYHVL